MSRGRRLNIPYGIYHTMARGNRKAMIFEDDRDRERFRDILSDAAERYSVNVLSECQVGNHYHLVVRTPWANLPAFEQYLNGVFAQYSNRRHGRTGHVFGERYKPVLVDDDLYLRTVLAYVVRNPVEAGLVEAPEQWNWSSYGATIGQAPTPDYLWLDWLDSAFPAPCRSESQERFRRYLAAPTIKDAEEWLFEAVVGAPGFTRRVRQHIGATLYKASLPRAYRALAQPPLNELFPKRCTREQQAQAALRAHVVHGYMLTEIARFLSVHPNTVSRMVSRLRHRGVDL